MSGFIEHIRISNFKSLQSCVINGCKRINLFIGKPNVGKSNILEALSLFSIPFLKENTSKKISNLIRLENETELFFNGNTREGAFVETNIGKSILRYNPKEGLTALVDFFSGGLYRDIIIDDKLIVKGIADLPGFKPPIKKYAYKQDIAYKKGHAKYLIPPFGYNLFSILEEYSDLKKDVIALFKEYRLELAFDKASQTIKVIQDNKEDGLFLIPYNSIADTLQRIIFYKAAIASNENSILLFEEPEAHSFPPYMTHLTQEMIYGKTNQYFIATHSPFILNDLLENAREELAVFVVGYENHETKTNQLTGDQLHEVFQNGVDLFTNNESFL
jgi:AAA15 family ATPase/GTPase